MESSEYGNTLAKMYTDGCSHKEMVDMTMKMFPEINEHKAMNKMRAKLHTLSKNGLIQMRPNGYRPGMKSTNDTRIERSKDKPTNVIEILKRGTTIEELSSEIGVSIKTTENIIEDIKKQGYNVQTIDDNIKIENLVIPSDNHYDSEWNGEKVIRFALMGDTQINSKYTQLTHLHKFYEICKEECITTVYHTGDIDEGEQMRIGHCYECYNQGADDHVKEIVRVYPKIDGIKTYFITGNHDASIIKRCGYDIGYPIANQREDMIYLGQSSAVINLTPNCTLELRHPIDGTAYALSYKLQKMVEAMSGGEKPNILAVGHYHKSEYMMYRNVHCFQTGSFQAQTPFMKGKGISAFVGGWIVEAHVDKSGTITRLKQEYIPFYNSIKDDYENWR